MPKLKAALLGAALAVSLSGLALAQDETEGPSADMVVATVNGTTITLGHLIAAVDELSDEQKGLPDDVLLEGITERLIQQAALSGMQKELPKAVELRLENERRALIASELVQDYAEEIDITDADLQSAYDEAFAEFEPQMEYNASHILVETEEEAQALRAQLDDGDDFAELAKEHSAGPSGPNGGSLGWFAKGQMVEPFQEAVEALEAGALSDPVETQFGWHLIKLNETRLPEAPKLDDVADELRNMQFRQKLGDRIDEALATADIERSDLSSIDPATLRDMSLISD